VHARVAMFEGRDPERLRQGIAEVKRRAASGPSKDMPAIEFLMLHKAEQGKVLTIALFETEEDMRRGDETLNRADPPGGPAGRRVSVEFYEVGVKLDAPRSATTA
jgi:hypothetical protein